MPQSLHNMNTFLNTCLNTFSSTLKHSMLLLAVLPVTLSLCPVSVQAEVAVPDRQGNYSRNETNVQAKRSSRYGTGSLWQVVVNSLNCRQEPSIDSPVKRTYLADDLLEVQIYRGGSDEVLMNPRDQNGRPWMPVRNEDSSNEACYVRANSRFIRPVVNENQPLRQF
jgi:hypothetical protein